MTKLDAKQEAERKRIAEQVRTLREGGGSTFRDAVETVAKDAALPIVKLGKNSKGKQIWSVGTGLESFLKLMENPEDFITDKKKKKNKGGSVKKYARGGGVRAARF